MKSFEPLSKQFFYTITKKKKYQRKQSQHGFVRKKRIFYLKKKEKKKQLFVYFFYFAPRSKSDNRPRAVSDAGRSRKPGHYWLRFRIRHNVYTPAQRCLTRKQSAFMGKSDCNSTPWGVSYAKRGPRGNGLITAQTRTTTGCAGSYIRARGINRCVFFFPRNDGGRPQSVRTTLAALGGCFVGVGAMGAVTPTIVPAWPRTVLYALRFRTAIIKIITHATSADPSNNEPRRPRVRGVVTRLDPKRFFF